MAAAIKSNCRKVVCIGRNYADHITELSSARPSQPFFFLKPSTSIHPPNSGPVLRPSGISLHYEIELGLVIGPTPSSKPIKNISASDTAAALGLIKEYVLTIDLTARNVQNEAKKKGLPWSIAKGFDTFLPISNVIAKSKIPDPHDVTIWLSVNDEMHQKDSTNLMLFQIPRLLADISKVMSLEEGDLILTGTPKGVGEIKPGDVVRGGIEINGKEIEEAKIQIEVEDAPGEEAGGYIYKET